MARTSQTAEPATVLPRLSIFVDHTGSQATCIRWFTEFPDGRSEPANARPDFSFQVYTTVPLEGDATKLAEYLEHGFEDGHPSLEIYTVQQPDVFACVEHQRREISYRKELVSTQLPLPLIPKVVRDSFDHRRQGFFVLITSACYLRKVPTEGVDPEGPVWVTFERRFPSRNIVDTKSRLEMESSPSFEIEEDELVVYPEKLEIRAKRNQITPASSMNNVLSTIYTSSCPYDDGPDYALEEDEGQPMEQLEDVPQTIAFHAQVTFLNLQATTGPGDAFTVSSEPVTSKFTPDLRYVVYAPFLHHTGIDEPGRLKNTASVFTAAIISHLANKTIHFEFHKPPEPTLSSIISYHQTKVLRTRPEMTVGALHDTSAGQTGTSSSNITRLYPCTQNEQLPFWPDMERYKTFVVVLDKPNFLDENGVLFAMTDGGKLKSSAENGTEWMAKENYYESQVWRSAGMREVARRLGMLVLEDSQNTE